MKRKPPIEFKQVSKLPILNFSGFLPTNGNFEVAKKHCYNVIKDVSVTGDAPKDIDRLYEYGASLKIQSNKWPIYIAKLGHKYYPSESVTEQLITDLGKWWGFEIADSKLCVIGDQIRFLSKYFLENHTDELYHGADMYAGFLSDKQFVDDIELKKMTQDFFTISFTRDVLTHFFHDSFNEIFKSFMIMLFFDALTGNNDRHMYNWGIIRDVYGTKLANFSPIYDSARGLLWNETEEKIFDIVNTKNRKVQFVRKYCENSRPKIGVENTKKVNHFQLIESYVEYFKHTEFVKNFFTENPIEDTLHKISVNYKPLMSEIRLELINEILAYRYSKLKSILS